MFPLWWIAARMAPGGQSAYPSAINACVHVVMYSYYLLAALGPSLQPYLWWKQYLTQLQLAQHFIVLGSTILAISEIRNNQCQFSEWMCWQQEL
eukprot:gene2131-8013_t